MNSKLFFSYVLTATAVTSSAGFLDAETIYKLDPMVVESSILGSDINDITQAWSIHEGKELSEIKSLTIGETLAFQPGITQSYYGPNASRPIIRGLDGDRVRVLNNGLDTFDVSSISVDHAVALDPLLTERVEVLRGSSALLYGANAIGGVVNAIDRTIPTFVPENGISGEIQSSYSSVNDGRSNGAIVYSGSGHFVTQVNSTYHKTENYDAPSFSTEDGLVDTVANSQDKTWSAGAGVSYIFDNGYSGLAYSYFDTEYGVPNDEAPTIKMERKRIEGRVSFNPDTIDWIQSLDLQVAYGNYRHNEIESSGEVAATFEREGIESRISMMHTVGDFKGVLGFQGNFDDTSIKGEENPFAGATGRNPAISDDDSQRIALFIMEDYEASKLWSFNVGSRIESVFHQYEGLEDKDKTTFSASTGVVYKPTEGWSVSGNINYTERAPETAELYSDGPHPATGGYQVGDSSLDKESALGIDAILRRTKGPLTGQLSAYYTKFDNYIYLSATGRELDPEGNDPSITGEEGLAERIYKGVSAEFYGFEGELDWLFYRKEDLQLTFHTFGDVLWAKNTTDNTYLPRTAPWRLGGGIKWEYSSFTFGTNLTYTGEQNKTAPNEDSTESYLLLDAYASYQFKIASTTTELFIKAKNLTDELAYVHTSFLKETAPLPGRNIEIGLNVKF